MPLRIRLMIARSCFRHHHDQGSSCRRGSCRPPHRRSEGYAGDQVKGSKISTSFPLSRHVQPVGNRVHFQHLEPHPDLLLRTTTRETGSITSRKETIGGSRRAVALPVELSPERARFRGDGRRYQPVRHVDDGDRIASVLKRTPFSLSRRARSSGGRSYPEPGNRSGNHVEQAYRVGP